MAKIIVDRSSVAAGDDVGSHLRKINSKILNASDIYSLLALYRLPSISGEIAYWEVEIDSVPIAYWSQQDGCLRAIDGYWRGSAKSVFFRYLNQKKPPFFERLPVIKRQNP